ncbi:MULTISPECIES: cytochrome c oxidase accessory protein CcoG [unclassified Sinorhizobium]|uniref:cytochrome c oxidase accessory protein CcoG n=1 Tax=unclassified Sinorhizobium TaxID=2613772 RepID=UPI0024C3A6C9|nr:MULTISPECIES: cytochrome c oxidase accessory protein CcoG [unclassified Sinorhizobium]MDK1376803.1 cytochrome c oxidase accessory protein CcoG [Sinorhizobium sp. 6-70]MDK1479575.1 cytochrome c oxidase accessory protein CcoG [Sinorhizobium sp. 6-117]
MATTTILDTVSPRKPARLAIPQTVRGRYRTIKTVVAAILLTFYFVTPWIRWDRGPQLPDQAVLFDLPGRRLFLFGLEFWPQDLPIAVGVLILGAFGLFGATTLAGRVWCGFTCPQTVWTDLFFTIERLCERLFGKDTLLSNVAKAIVQVTLAIATAIGFAAYFNDALTFPHALVTGAAPMGAYIAVGVLTLTTWLFAAYAKERVCLHMCPWPRFQAALLDKDSLVVTYQRWRGEPRGKKKVPLRSTLTDLSALVREASSFDAGRGDCIDCQRCVNVCPTGIDIRDGLQMGCIGCGLCIDACDDVMARIGRPAGLIRFDVEGSDSAGSFQKPTVRFLRPKTLLYAILCLVALGSSVFGTLRMKSVLVDIDPQRGQPFVQLSDGSVRNDFSFRLAHRLPTLDRIAIHAEGLPGATLRFADAQTGHEAVHLAVPGNRRISDRLFITAAPRRGPSGRTNIRIVVTNAANGATLEEVETYFWGPAR